MRGRTSTRLGEAEGVGWQTAARSGLRALPRARDWAWVWWFVAVRLGAKADGNIDNLQAI